MDHSTNSAESLFARALELPPGPARREFLAAECRGNPELLAEIESLLRADSEAGEFLQPKVRETITVRPLTTQPGLSAAAHADIFLREAMEGAEGRYQEYVAALPVEVRQETRERIEATLRIRKVFALPRGRTAETAEPVPQVPGFRIERKLGEGGLGTVYAAHDEKLNRRVALKVLRQRADELLRRRVLDEARRAAALGDPAIVTIYSVLDESNPPAIVMELIEGFPLDRFAAQLTFEQKARLLREIVRGLATAHAQGIVHRDLKPDNIIVGPDMRPRILDFGLALSLEEASRLGGHFEGTPLYASPEQAMGRPLTAASDIFSLGSLMFKVLTGRTPFAGGTITQTLEAIATTAPPFLREVSVGVPEDLQAICLACLAWKPEDRPTAADLVLEFGRYLVGEPVRLRPKLYDDLLRRSISEHASQAHAWESQSIISREERDDLEVVHRRLLADEDHWIIDARRITLMQTLLSGGTWLAVVATVLTVWMLREELAPQWRWLLPCYFTLTLFAAGHLAQRQKENLSSATFLAGATLVIAPCALALLAELGLFARGAGKVVQLFPDNFTNQQVLVASLTALAVSTFGLWRLKLTGFAWTTATLATTSYLSFLLLFNWLGQKPEIQALWCLPLAAMEPIGLALEKCGRVRWSMPFHLVALIALVGGLDVIAYNGPTLEMLGVSATKWAYFNHDRQIALSFVLNGGLFLLLMLATERSKSLDLRRASKLLEVLAILHTLSALFLNAMNQRSDPQVRTDVFLYLAAALSFTALAALRSRWRLLVGGLAGCGLGSYLLVDLGLVARLPFILGLGFTGLVVALGAAAYVRRSAGSKPRN